ncbi:MAG: hypothetical protein IPF59_14085 [Ignavibacteria bacterium]|nr:hypothetical protein [Ignavibacteria bacterium]
MIEAPRASPTVQLDLESTMTDGSTMPGGDVLITEQRSSDVGPFLPFVFFDREFRSSPTDMQRADPLTSVNPLSMIVFSASTINF